MWKRPSPVSSRGRRGGRLVDTGIPQRLRFRESLIDEAQDVGAVALFLKLATGNLGLDESAHAFRWITDFVGFLQKVRGYRDTGHKFTFSTGLDGCKEVEAGRAVRFVKMVWERRGGVCLSRNDAEPLTTDFTDDTDAKHLDEGQETVKKVHHLVSNPPAGIVLKFL